MYTVIANPVFGQHTSLFYGGVYSRHKVKARAFASLEKFQRNHRRANPNSHLNLMVVYVEAWTFSDRIGGKRVDNG